jgi:phosphate transport system permease protein
MKSKSGLKSTDVSFSLDLTERDINRRRVNRIMTRVIQLSAFLAVIPLIGIVLVVASNGLPGLSLSFLTNGPVDQPRGIFSAIQGSLTMTFVALLASAPIGIGGGIYLHEYASERTMRVGELVIDVMLGVPSILAGLFAFFALVPIIGHSGWAAAISLTVLMIPVVMRTTQEVLRLVPVGLREASLALGVPRWKTTIFITCRTAISGILTGIVLAISRGLGETAPLLLTSQNSSDSAFDLGARTNSMTVTIFTWAGSPDPRDITQAWTTALVLFAMALVLNVLVRFKTINSRVL